MDDPQDISNDLAPASTWVITDGGGDGINAVGAYSDLVEAEAELERLRAEHRADRELRQVVRLRLEPLVEDLRTRGLGEAEIVTLIEEVVFEWPLPEAGLVGRFDSLHELNGGRAIEV